MSGFVKQALQNKWNILLLLVAAFAIWNVTQSGLFQTDRDFHHFYLAAQRLLSGAALYEQDGGAYIYPPFYAFLIIPFTHLPEIWAVNLWLVISIVLLILSSVLGLSILNSAFQLNLTRWQMAGIGAAAILMMYNPLFHEFLQGQNDIFILFGCTLALYLLDRHPWTAGIILGLIIDIKYQALCLLLLLLLRARWRTVSGLIAGVIIGALLPALVIGWQLNIDYLHIALRGLIHVTASANTNNPAAQVPSILWYGNVSLTNGLARIFDNQGWAIENALFLALGLAVLCFLLMWHIYQKNDVPLIWRTPHTLSNPQQETAIISLEWSIVLAFMLVFSPECSRRHLLLIFNLNLLAVMMMLYPRPQIKRWLVFIAGAIGVICEGRISLSPHSLYNTDYFGFPGWGYLIFLLIIASQGLRYCTETRVIKNFQYQETFT